VTGFSFDVGAEVDYHCEPGHYSSGEMKRVCTREANWSGSTPNCTCELFEWMLEEQYSDIYKKSTNNKLLIQICYSRH